jgi:hypothetical protein
MGGGTPYLVVSEQFREGAAGRSPGRAEAGSGVVLRGGRKRIMFTTSKINSVRGTIPPWKGAEYNHSYIVLFNEQRARPEIRPVGSLGKMSGDPRRAFSLLRK